MPGQYQDWYTTFVDLTKAFDTVSCDGWWKIMAKFGYPDRFNNIIRQSHDGIMARVLDNKEASSDFPVTNGVKQGYVLAPTLFSITFLPCYLILLTKKILGNMSDSVQMGSSSIY